MEDFPGGQWLRPLCFPCRGSWFDPGPGTKIPYASWAAKKKGVSIDTCCDIGETWKHSTKRNKQRLHLFYSIYMKYPDGQIYRQKAG